MKGLLPPEVEAEVTRTIEAHQHPLMFVTLSGAHSTASPLPTPTSTSAASTSSHPPPSSVSTASRTPWRR